MAPNVHRPARLSHRVSLSDLEILVAVTLHGSMAKAANQLGISQPAISRAIAEMEAALGLRLLDRSRRGALPTLYGSVFAQHAAAMLDDLRQGMKEIEFLSDPTAGEIFVGAPEPLTEAILPNVIQKFAQDYPRVRVHIIPTSAGDFVELRARKLDFQINRLLWDFASDDIAAEPLFNERIFVVVGARSPWLRRKNVKLADLITEKWVVQNNAYDNVAYAFQTRRLPIPRAAIAAYSAFLRNHLTASGNFIAIVAAPQLMVLRNQGFKVKVLPIDLSDLTIKVAIFQLKKRTLSSVSRLFLKYIRAECQSARFMKAMNAAA